MIKIEKVSYKALKSLSISDRIKATSDPGIGNTLMSALTPSQIADLFPSYYRQRMPDIEGFMKAVPSSVTSEKQAYYEQQIQNAASGGKEGATLTPFKPSEGAWNKLKRKVSEATGVATGKGKPLPKAQLTSAQLSAIEDLKKGNIAVDDPRVKFMAGLTNEQLRVTGIQKIKDQSGKEVFNYTTPTVSDEDVKKSFIPEKGSFGERASSVMKRLQSDLGVTKEQAAGMVGSLGAETGGLKAIQEAKPWAGRGGFGWAQWTGPRRVAFEKFAAAKGLDITSDEANYQFLVQELRTTHSGELQRVKQARTAEEAATLFTGTADVAHGGRGAYGYLRPGAEHFDRSIRYTNQALSYSGGEMVNRDMTPSQIEARRNQLIQQQELSRVGSLAEFTSPQLGQSPDIRHATDSGSTDINSLMARAQEIGQQSDKGFTMGGPNGRGQQSCGVGARSMAGALFNNTYFSQGLGSGGSAAAGSLSGDNAYFQKSGLYNNAVSAGDLSDPAYKASLPVGTVISAQGGKSGNGHVQIKYGPGPNDWASDFNQKEHGGVLLHGYSNYMVHIPNDKGQQILGERGYAITSTPASVTREVNNPNPPGVAPSLNSYTGAEVGPTPDIRHPDQPVPGPSQPTSTQTQNAPESVASKVSSAPKIEAKSTVSSGNYNVNINQFREAIKKDPSNSYPGWAIDMASNDDIRNGFNNDARVKAAGVHIDENWKMQVKDINNPDVKDILSGAQKQGALKAIEEKRKADIKPGESKTPTAQVSPRESDTKAVADESKSGGADSPQHDIDRTMAIIRRQESGSFGGDYSADAAKKTKGKMTASGAYQFNNKTWNAVTKEYNLGREYKRAVDAPREVQDAVMRARMEDLYKKHGSLEKVLMTHFTGNAAGKMSAKAIAANKGLTGPQYVSSIIGKHGPEYDKMKSEVKPVTSTADISPSASSPQVIPASMPGVATKDRVAPNVSPGVDRSHEVRNEIQNLRNDMQIANVTKDRDITPREFKPTVGENEPNMIGNMMMQTQTAYANPTAERALGARPNFSETGDSRQHFSIGNTA